MNAELSNTTLINNCTTLHDLHCSYYTMSNVALGHELLKIARMAHLKCDHHDSLSDITSILRNPLPELARDLGVTDGFYDDEITQPVLTQIDDRTEYRITVSKILFNIGAFETYTTSDNLSALDILRHDITKGNIIEIALNRIAPADEWMTSERYDDNAYGDIAQIFVDISKNSGKPVQTHWTPDF